ncbi:hypothetical protein ACFQ9X_26180 [Catenulispora yoronensis]
MSDAENLDAAPDSFELAVIGNAFHRLERAEVARRLLDWLAPGGHLALCWSTSPWVGEAAWQRSLADTLHRWQQRLGAESRNPASAAQDRQNLPDAEMLSASGFEVLGRHTFAVEHTWSLEDLLGHVRSTSFLPPLVLGDQAAAFDADLAASLRPHADGGGSTAAADAPAFTEAVSCAYDLARKPA